MVVGGDGTVTKALDALLKKTQKDAGIVVKNTTTPAKASLPLAIIPIGKPYTRYLNPILLLKYYSLIFLCNIIKPFSFSSSYGFITKSSPSLCTTMYKNCILLFIFCILPVLPCG